MPGHYFTPQRAVDSGTNRAALQGSLRQTERPHHRVCRVETTTTLRGVGRLILFFFLRDHRWQGIAFGNQRHRYRIDAMPRVFWRHSLA